MNTTHKGFTLIEILVVMGMITILASVVLVAVNPLRQFAQARNSQRISNVNAILNAIGNRLAENRGLFTDTDCSSLPTNPTSIARTGYDLRPCLVPLYLSELPYDPKDGTNTCITSSCTSAGENYDTGYTISQASSTGRITICAPGAAESVIEGSKEYCLTR